MSGSSKRARQTPTVQTTRQSPLVTSLDVEAHSTRRGLGANSAGQSDDTQGLSKATTYLTYRESSGMIHSWRLQRPSKTQSSFSRTTRTAIEPS
jgi:hypothetical protein